MKNSQNETENLSELEKKIVNLLETKIRPAVSRDGGDIVFQKFSEGVVTVKLKGSCSGCPSSTLTLKKVLKIYFVIIFPKLRKLYQFNENYLFLW